ncbi:MAG: helix-turn-helix transcriptional regulator [Clostridia bacterium]|nr:helix-turn-helix transcriptional regulator [Clostridia bacterium]
MKCFFNHCSEAITHTLQSKTFGLYYSETAKSNQDIHVHDCSEIFLCLTSGNHFLIDGKVYTADKNDLFIINHLQPHKVAPLNFDDFVRFSFHVSPAFIEANSTKNVNLSNCFYGENKIDKITLGDSEREKLISLFKQLEISKEYGDEVYKNLTAVEILLFINELVGAHGNSSLSKSSHPSLERAIDFINHNYDKNLNLSIIAQNSYVSVNQLCALFQTYLSTTVIKYLTSKRITHAKKLLLSGKSVTETAFSCGFNDYANFIRTFKQAVGISPGKYAKREG